jgi:RHS repeat-associated protein
MFKKRSLSDKQILIFVRLINASKKFLVILALIGQLVSILPHQIVRATNVVNNHNQEVVDEYKAYQSDDVDISLVPIASEDTSKRTANEKHFRKMDGTYEVAIYNHQIHYLENDTWHDIDNRFDDYGEKLTNKSNQFKVSFPKNLSDNKSITLTTNAYSIEWKILDILRSSATYENTQKNEILTTELSSINQSVMYKDVRESVDIEYILQGLNIKEYIILKEYLDSFTMTFEYTLKNLKLVETEEGICFIDTNNASVFKFDDLFMIDSDDHISHDIDYQILETKKDTYQITIIPNNEWLNKASYPVMIDPTLMSTTTPMTIQDTYISQAYPTNNYANNQHMYLSNTSINAQYKGLITFEIPEDIMNQVITYAHLSFTPYITTTNAQLNIYKNIQSFDHELVTWYDAPSYDTTVVDYHIVKNGSPFIYDITKPIKEWQSEGISEIDGFTIAHDDIYGSFNAVYQNHSLVSSTNRPIVKIGYEEPSGLKDYWTYTSQDLGMAGTGYISDYTGNLTWVRNEYQLKNEFLSMSLSFFHNGYSRSIDIGYGNGWRTNYTIEISYDSTASTYYMHKPDGNKIYFMNNVCTQTSYYTQSCKSIAEDGSGMILERITYLGQNSSMKVTTKSNIEYSFNNLGRLSIVKNTKTNHSIWIHYIDSTSLKISYVKDEADNRIHFSYNSAILSQTTLSLKQDNETYRQVERRDYFYDNNNNLDYIDYDFRYGNDVNTDWTTDTNNRLQFDFDSEHYLLSSVYNEKDNFKVEYSYDLNQRVNQIITSDDNLPLGSTEITFEPSKTTYTDYEDNHIYYLFDHYGHTVNIMDSHGNSTYYRYSGLFSNLDGLWDPINGYDLVNLSPNYFNNHKLLESSDIIKQQQNPLLNHGFEETNYGWTLNQGTGNIEFSYDEAVLGNKSLKITRLTSSVFANQQVYLTPGEYMIQGWIKNSGGSPGAYIDVDNVQWKGTIEKVYDSGEWKKYELTFYVAYPNTINVKLINESNNSDAYFDNIQISEGFVDTRYNPIANNSFESGTFNWTLNGATVVNISESGILHDILGGKALKIDGDGGVNKQAYQTITDLVTSGETYVVGGWAKANAVPNKGYVDGSEKSDGRFFGYIIKFTCIPSEFGDPSQPYPVYIYMPFDTSIEDWQYQMHSFLVPQFAVNIEIFARYNGEGTAYFDNIQLYHDDLSTKYGYNTSTGNLITIAKPNGTTTVLDYDINGNIISVTQDNKEIEINRNASYQVEEILSSNNVRTTFVYDSAKKQLIETYVGYDKDSATQDKWFKTSTTYTSDGQYIHTIKDEFGNVTTSTVDKTIGTVTELIDAIGTIQTFIYDEYGNLVNVTIDSNTSSNILTGDYEYDVVGRLWKVHRDGYSYEFVYNILNQIVGVSIAGTTVMSYEYWMDGTEEYYTNLLKRQNYGNTDFIEFTYNSERQIETVSFKETLRYEYMYDSMGNLSVLKNFHNNNIYFYSYDLAGRLEKVTDKDGNEITYEYDESGNIDQYSYNISGITRGVTYRFNHSTGEYDYTIYSVGGTTIKNDFNYDEDSLRRLNSIDLIIGTNIFKKIFTYDNQKVDSTMGNATHRVYRITYKKNDTTQHYHQYNYDEKHNITQIVVKLPAWTFEQYDYFYDEFNQLTREDIFLVGQLQKTLVYSYNSQNNLTSIKTYAYQIVSGKPQSEKRLYYQNTWKDQLTKIEYYVFNVLSYYQTLSYDDSGNVISLTDSRTSNEDKSYEWEGRQLVNYTDYFNELTFKYNDQGIRTQKISNDTITTNYILDGDRVLVENRSNGITLYFTYDVDGSLLSMNYNGNEYFYITNAQGDIIEMVNIYGNSVVKYKYDAWGNIISQTGGNLADINPYRYRGYRYDVETGLYYLQSRYYDPTIGRFISADGLIGEIGSLQTHNMYAYCVNNPVMMVDPNGNFAWLIFAAIILFTPVGGTALQIAASTLSYVGMAVASIWDTEIREDMNAIGWNPINSSEQKVVNSSKISWYKGMPVFRSNGKSGSFGVILLSRTSFTGTSGHYWSPQDILRHEFGHGIQQLTYGPGGYLFNIGIPSVFIDNSDDAPWEITADIFGDVNRTYKSNDLKTGWQYFGWGRIVGPYWWW